MDKGYEISGRVRASDGTGVQGIMIDVLDRDLTCYEELGTTYSRSDGSFVFRYEPTVLDRWIEGQARGPRRHERRQRRGRVRESGAALWCR